MTNPQHLILEVAQGIADACHGLAGELANNDTYAKSHQSTLDAIGQLISAGFTIETLLRQQQWQSWEDDEPPKHLELVLCVNEFGGLWIDQYCKHNGFDDETPLYWRSLDSLDAPSPPEPPNE